MRIYLILMIVLLSSCGDQVKTAGNKSGDSTAKTLNKSDIINDSTRLPKDSTNTGVQH